MIESIWNGIVDFVQNATADRWFIYLGIFLIVIDIFVKTDLPTFAAYLLFTFVVYRHLPGPVIVRLTVSVIVFFAFVFLYYFVWGKFKQMIVDKFFAKDVMKSGAEALVGEAGIIRVIDGIQSAQIHGDIYPLHEPVTFPDGTPFVVKHVENGMIVPEFSLPNNITTSM